MATIHYWKDVDVLDIVVKRGKYCFSEPVAEDVILDLSDSGEILSVEIHHAAKKLSRKAARKLTRQYVAVQ